MNIKSSTNKSAIIPGQTKQALARLPGIYAEDARNIPRSPTPSWRKPDPSQWRYKLR